MPVALFNSRDSCRTLSVIAASCKVIKAFKSFKSYSVLSSCRNFVFAQTVRGCLKSIRLYQDPPLPPLEKLQCIHKSLSQQLTISGTAPQKPQEMFCGSKTCPLSKERYVRQDYGKNPGFLAKTFSMSLKISDIEKVKLPSHKGFSISLSVAKKWIKSSLDNQFL